MFGVRLFDIMVYFRLQEAYQRAKFMFVALCVLYVFMSTVMQVRQRIVVVGEISVVTVTQTYIVFDYYYQNNFMIFIFAKLSINEMWIVMDTIT